MANIFDYLAWRGDLSLRQDPFNEVDNLVLATLSYIDFAGIVPASGEEQLSLAEAQKAYEARHGQEKLVGPGQGFWRNNLRLLKMAAQTSRFGQMQLSGYCAHLDPDSEEQFAAVTFLLEDATAYLSFRGTDDTLVGWKENFNMSFMPQVPSQVDAVAYLERQAAVLKSGLRLGGHSKGGNLAAYAASFCASSVRERIIQVYNNDGPGFDRPIIASSGYQSVCRQMHTLVPQSSIVGMLLEHEEDYTIIRSRQIGLMQHDPYSWEVERNGFVTLDAVTGSSRFIDRTLKDWLTVMSVSERAMVIDTLYEILEATEAKTRTELTTGWYKNARIILKSLKQIDGPTRQVIQQVLSALVQSARDNLFLGRAGLKDES